MTWNDFHNRGETLRAVVAAADEDRDGLLPMHVAGVSESFTDELDLLSALMLKWHARLSGNLERELMMEPTDLEDAVARAWRRTADDLPGLRLVADHYTDHPTTSDMAAALNRATRREHARLATAAGLASDDGDAAVAAGARVVARARTLPESAPSRAAGTPAPRAAHVAETASLVERIKAVLAA